MVQGEITRRLTGVPLVPTDLTQFIATVGVAGDRRYSGKGACRCFSDKSASFSTGHVNFTVVPERIHRGPGVRIQRVPAQIASEVPYVLLRVGTIALLNNIAPLDGGVDTLA